MYNIKLFHKDKYIEAKKLNLVRCYENWITERIINWLYSYFGQRLFFTTSYMGLFLGYREFYC